MKKFVYMIILGSLMCIQSYAADGVKPYSFYEADSITTIERYSVSVLLRADNGDLWYGFANAYTPWRTFDYPLGYVRNDTFYKVKNFPSPSPGRVFDLKETNNGILAATDAGLFKYDGVQWTKIPGFPGDIVRCLAVDGKNILAGTDSGAVLIKGVTMTFIQENNSLLPNNVIQCVELDDQGGVYLGTQAGLYVKNNSGEKVFSKNAGNLSGNNVTTVAYFNDQIWFGLTDFQSLGKLNVFDISTNNLKDLEEISHCYMDLKGWSFSKLLPEDNQSLWMVTMDDNVVGNNLILKVGQDKVKRYLMDEEYFKVRTVPMIQEDDGSFRFVDYRSNQYTWNPNDHSIFRDWSPASVQYLEVNQVRTPILPHAEMFWTKNITGPTYEVPKNSCLSTAFVTGLWVGAMDGNSNLHIAASTYAQRGTDYGYGVLNPQTGRFDSVLTALLKLKEPRVVWKEEVEAFKNAWMDGSVQNGTFIIPKSIIDWPGNRGTTGLKLAPFHDENQDGYYNPLEGDYPAIKGDQCIFHIFHDDVLHSESGGMPMGIEVQVLSYAFKCAAIDEEDADVALNYSTFHEYTIINMSQNDYSDCYTGMFADMAIGNYFDDYVGCDSTLQAGFVYNADNNDQSAYGENPPTQAMVFYKEKMDVFAAYANDFSVKGIPTTAPHYYYYLSGFNKDGTPLEGEGGAPTRYQFSGTPYVSGSYVDSIQSDKRFVMSSKRGAFKKGDTLDLAFAMVYSRDENHPNGYSTSYQRMIRDIQAVREWTSSQSFPSCGGPALVSQDIEPSIPVKLYPNPGNQLLQISTETMDALRFEIYSLDGKLVKSGVLQAGNGTIETNDLTPGIFLIRLSSDTLQWSGKWVKAKN